MGPPPGPGPGPGLARYGSAPGSLLAGIAESVIRGGGGGGEPAAGRWSAEPVLPGRVQLAGPTASSMASPDSTSAYGSGELHVAAPAKWAPSLQAAPSSATAAPPRECSLTSWRRWTTTTTATTTTTSVSLPRDSHPTRLT
uniref:Uncharacterized protein n=1 Tax=Ananas comosus var. bracteatus TaxID=296719 RepID=A0A6V7PNK8_ANACO|nr:unnamed protein product [Ananas comosus var. bracteatus]